MEPLHCPECGAVVYSRRSPLCGVCGKPLPESFRFDADQSAVLEEELNRAKASLRVLINTPDSPPLNSGFP